MIEHTDHNESGPMQDAHSPPDPVRARIEARIAALGRTMADVSRALGKNHAYMHQFLAGKRGQPTPRVLDEDTREKLAEVLGVPPDSLRAARGPAPAIPAHRPGAIAMTAFSGHAAAGRLPVYLDTDAIDPANAREWLQPPDFGPVSCAIWITRAHGRLRTGDLAFVRFAQPVRAGDIVLAVQNKRIAALGDMHTLTEDDTQIGDATFPLASVELSKVVAVLFA
jgi:transcriptional regulator with XRE-family HTH domain